MKNIRAAVALFLLAVFLAGDAFANTSSVNPNVPAQNSPLSSSILRGNFGNAYNDINTIYGMLASPPTSCSAPSMLATQARSISRHAPPALFRGRPAPASDVTQSMASPAR